MKSEYALSTAREHEKMFNLDCVWYCFIVSWSHLCMLLVLEFKFLRCVWSGPELNPNMAVHVTSVLWGAVVVNLFRQTTKTTRRIRPPGLHNSWPFGFRLPIISVKQLYMLGLTISPGTWGSARDIHLPFFPLHSPLHVIVNIIQIHLVENEWEKKKYDNRC